MPNFSGVELTCVQRQSQPEEEATKTEKVDSLLAQLEEQRKAMMAVWGLKNAELADCGASVSGARRALRAMRGFLFLHRAMW